MKVILYITIPIVIVFAVFLIPLQYLRGAFWPIIDQDVKLEKDGNFKVRTYIFHGDIIWSHYTWEDLGLRKGVTLEQLDSAKKANYRMAEEVLIRYNKARKQ